MSMSELSIDWSRVRNDLSDPAAIARITAAVLPLHRQMTPNPPPAIGIVEPSEPQGRG